MHPKPSLLLITLLMAITCMAHGQDVPSATSGREIQALLDFLAHSHCTFIRNGKSYDATRAESHLEDKLHYLQRRDQVHTAEEFITRAGSQSSLSGEPYQVNCDGKLQASEAWLRTELQRIRAKPP